MHDVEAGSAEKKGRDRPGLFEPEPRFNPFLRARFAPRAARVRQIPEKIPRTIADLAALPPSSRSHARNNPYPAEFSRAGLVLRRCATVMRHLTAVQSTVQRAATTF